MRQWSRRPWVEISIAFSLVSIIILLAIMVQRGASNRETESQFYAECMEHYGWDPLRSDGCRDIAEYRRKETER